MSIKFTYTDSQQQAIIKFAEFVNSAKERVFILKGYAGTGKTTLVKEFINRLQKNGKPFSLLASTGRAAKILSNIAGVTASTVHGEIYKFNDFNQDIESFASDIENKNIIRSQLLLQFKIAGGGEKNQKETIYIVDEASMISDEEDKDPVQAVYGSGRLLTDLFSYAPKGKFVFVGDYCQLPPVKQRFSPALTSGYFKRFDNTAVCEAELTEIVRQSKTNDLVFASNKIRTLRDNPGKNKWAKFPLRGYKNIKIYNDKMAMINDYVNIIKKEGYNKATFICRSNKTSVQLTSLIRPALGFYGDTLQKGDLLLVTQNNESGLMNGDLVKIASIGERVRRANLTFINVQIEELVTKKIFSKLLIEEIVYQNGINLTKEQQRGLYIDYYHRMKKQNISPKSKEFKDNMLKDEYVNALRAVYGYVLTCHKAQGGEWDYVYLDIPRSLPLRPDNTAYQWLYTAMTRAREHLFIKDDFYLI